MKKFILPFLLILVLVIFAVTPSFIHVNILCRSNAGPCSPTISDSLSKLNGTDLNKAKNAVKKILKGNLLVSDFAIQYRLPDVIEVNLIENVPVFAIFDVASGKYYLVDAKGEVLYIDSKTDMPSISGQFGQMKLGEVVAPEYLTGLQIVEGISQMYQIRIGQVDGDTLLVKLPGPVSVVFPLSGTDYHVLLGAVRLIYTRIQNADLAGKYTQIDLRYKNPILR